MAKQKETKAGHGKLLDAWVPDAAAGEPIGCVATSFTFSPVLFEEECLSRFLNLETDPAEDGALYIIEREEKLAQLMCAGVVVDQHHARGTRSLRWDLLPARVPQGIMHAKVSLLLWANWARVIVGSANLTEDGYRRNQEVYGVLDYYPNGGCSLGCLRGVLAFLRDLAASVDQGPATRRWQSFLAAVESRSAGWGNMESSSREAQVGFLGLSLKSEDVFSAIKELWGSRPPPHSASVLSPFFDPAEAPNLPALGIWKLLKQRGEATVQYHLVANEIPGEKALFLHAPESLKTCEPGRDSVSTEFLRLELENNRPLHAKGLMLQNDAHSLYLAGSSNFTTAGLGLGRVRNVEANLVYQGLDTKALNCSFLWGEEIPEDMELRWKPSLEDGDEAVTEMVLLPREFQSAVFTHNEKGDGVVLLSLSGAPPRGWMIFPEDRTNVALFTESEWQGAGSPAVVTLPWSGKRPASGLCVTWIGAGGQAWWPVNVEASEDLPPPDELKDLPLDVLIEILTSARPPYRILSKWLNRAKTTDPAETVLIDPHKRVDTSTFLLQRTRRISWALAGLKARLESPIPSREALRWRLYGPTGVMALAAAIGREARSEAEKVFLVTELALELGRVTPKITPASLPEAEVRQALKDLVVVLKKQVPQDALAELPELKAYVLDAFQEAGR